MAAPKFRIDGVAPNCPDPEHIEWQEMVQLQVALSGRGVQQGRLRCTITWDVMADEDYGALMTIWKAKRDTGPMGFRCTSIVVPPFAGADNASWPTFTGGVGGYILMRRPTGLREVLYVSRVSLTFEDIHED